ncbi:MAG: uncharacterized protein KVP18_000221 [Porospora cf. gigantea A]|uniref:uncharacterized protein n=1 Tax=Porospora cf. gigantea A TaxID=2853593 RepID=UPI00355A5EAB|nr:MAG: hypothetical protein KVP18_000221 [Porospora cf. gigantea A]
MRLLSLLISVALASQTKDAEPADFQLAFPRSGGLLTLHNPVVGDSLEISLVSNITTGYDWEVSSARQVKLISQNYIEKPTKMKGAPGTSVFRFDLEEEPADGEQLIKLVYKRSWTDDIVAEALVEVLMD